MRPGITGKAAARGDRWRGGTPFGLVVLLALVTYQMHLKLVGVRG